MIPSVRLLNSTDLEKSVVVLNPLMNRHRTLAGKCNSYKKELGVNFAQILSNTAKPGDAPNWLDIGCGKGLALIETAKILWDEGKYEVALVGIDLIPNFAGYASHLKNLHLISASVETWQSAVKYDHITCIHGLHYLGDKLSIILKIATWLKPNGIFMGHIDFRNFKFPNGKSAGRAVLSTLSEMGFSYNSRNHLLTCTGKRVKAAYPPFHYLGADDQAGPNFTTEPAIDSYYEKA